MSVSLKFLLAAVLVGAFCVAEAHAEKKTVCSITVNSPDEKQIFRRNLPADEFDFVELVERGRPDWLASACRAGVRCDVLYVTSEPNRLFSFCIESKVMMPSTNARARPAKPT